MVMGDDDQFSQEYYKALEDSKTHHREHKTFSGKFLIKHVDIIKEIIEQYKIKTILDYGCGKGLQYRLLVKDDLTIEEYWGIETVKYDPAWPDYAKEPVGEFDLVLCTHVLGTIPIHDLPAFVKRLFSHTKNVLYIAERIGMPKKDWTNAAETNCPVGWTAMQWIDLIAPLRPGGRKVFITVAYPRPDGIVYGRFKL